MQVFHARIYDACMQGVLARDRKFCSHTHTHTHTLNQGCAHEATCHGGDV